MSLQIWSRWTDGNNTIKYLIARGHVISSQWKENLEEMRDKDISCSAGGVGRHIASWLNQIIDLFSLFGIYRIIPDNFWI